jgi:hypothetical protein
MSVRPESLIGTWRRFGAVGPAYEIVSIGQEQNNGDRVVRIRLAETGEEADYTLSHALEDEILADKAR